MKPFSLDELSLIAGAVQIALSSCDRKYHRRLLRLRVRVLEHIKKLIPEAERRRAARERRAARRMPTVSRDEADSWHELLTKGERT